jgi:hypothetical protein
MEEKTEKTEEKAEIVNEIPEKFKKKAVRKGFSMYIKDFLVYMNIIEREVNIDDVIKEKSRDLLSWVVNIWVSGFLINLAMTPIYIFTKFYLNCFNYTLLTFGYGMLYWIALKARKEFR